MKAYKQYQTYKKSHIKWLGDVPMHWAVDRAKWSIHRVQNGIWGAEPDGADDIVCIRVADFDRKSKTVSLENLTLRNISPKEREGRLLKKGDLLIEKSGGGDKQLVGAVVSFNHDFTAVTSNFVAKMSTHESCNSRFLTYVHSHLYDGNVNYRSIKQTTGIQNLDSQQYLDESIPYPPLEEQKVIADFLDYKTAQIDALIAKKEALLLKLQEKRSALITQAVTKGINPNAAMKPSGVEWLGEIPAHWEVIPIKYALDMPITDGPHSTPEFFDDGIPFLSAESVKNDELDFNKKRGFISAEDHAVFSQKYKPKRGDVYMVKSGATTGNVARVKTDVEFNIWSPLAVLRPHTKKSTTDFIFYVLKSKSFFYSVELSWSFGTQQNIGMGVISNIRIALPPISEQIKICEYLTPSVSQFDKQKEIVESAITKLQEYRSALITNAVTGKIDVRDFDIPSEN